MECDKHMDHSPVPSGCGHLSISTTSLSLESRHHPIVGNNLREDIGPFVITNDQCDNQDKTLMHGGETNGAPELDYFWKIKTIKLKVGEYWMRPPFINKSNTPTRLCTQKTKCSVCKDAC